MSEEENNTLSKLNDHLFSQMERLSVDGLKGDELEQEIKRTSSVTSVAKEIISNARLALDAAVKSSDLPMAIKKPKMLS